MLTKENERAEKRKLEQGLTTNCLPSVAVSERQFN